MFRKAPTGFAITSDSAPSTFLAQRLLYRVGMLSYIYYGARVHRINLYGLD
jgi:hypothetical protein